MCQNHSKNRDASNKSDTTATSHNTSSNEEKSDNRHKKKLTYRDNQNDSKGTPSAPATFSCRRGTTGNCPSVAAIIKGSDDSGIFYNSHGELRRVQNCCREEFYKANALYWSTGGYGGLTDEEAMIGDSGGIQDGEEGLLFLDKLLALAELSAALAPGSTTNNHGNKKNPKRLVDRVTKHILLKHYNMV